MLTLRVTAVVVLVLLDQTASAPTSEHQQYLAQTISRSHFEFSVDLYRQLVSDLSNANSSSGGGTDTDSAAGNLVFSPFSVHAVLSMLFMGTSSSSDSSRQLRAALHYEDVSYVDAHSAFKEVVGVLSDSYYEHKVLAANGVFVQAGVQLSQPYDRAAKEFYKAKVDSMDFRNADPSQTMGVINDWVSDVTDGQIAHLMDAPPSPDAKMVIVNALSMDAKWLNQFDPAETFDKGLFFLPGNKRLEVPMMSGRFSLPLGYSPEMECRILELPFTQKRISLFLVLPDDPGIDGLERLEANLTSDSLKSLFSTLQDGELVNVRVPRFRIASDVSVSDALKTLGVQDIFDPDKSDLQLMAPEAGLYVSTIAHKSVLEVREKGARGSAATYAAVERVGTLGQRFFEVDHPFLFLIWDYYSGMLLLMGRVTHPDVIAEDE